MVGRYLAKPVFCRNDIPKYIAVKPIKHKGGIMPGESVAHLRRHHLMSLHHRNRIGIKGHPWTQRILNRWMELNKPEGLDLKAWWDGFEKARKGFDLKAWWDGFESERAVAAAQSDAEKSWPAETDEDYDWDEPVTKVEPKKRPEPVKDGSQWVIDGLEKKFTSKKKALEAWDAEHG